ncbi:tripartite motif-containing protein 2-like [Ptychodera flava]|uniref:tripartite motif-containing protein 2-like n=1 Tax=Ptychodera flava TaxID=63121 RepID=UPI00396A1EA2
MTKSGHVIVDDRSNHRLQSFALQGKHQAIYKFTEIANFTPVYSAVSEDGKIFTTDNGNKQVVVCDENGQLIKCFGKDQLKYVFGIAISPYNGNVYVVDYSAHCIRIYSQSGDYIKCFGSQGNRAGQFSNPWDITVESSEGKVFVSDPGSHSVKVFDADGGFLFSFGSCGSADGKFNNPWGICNDLHGNVYVCDYSNNRVQKFSSSGAFICQVDCGTEALRGPTGVCVTGKIPSR